jgi:hypothetical protein
VSGFLCQRKSKPNPQRRRQKIFTYHWIDMEAERLNAIESSLADLRARAGELRGYL